MKIIIVDDSPMKLRTIKDSVERALYGKDYNITTFEYGVDAFMAAMNDDYDYIITDMQYCWSENSRLDFHCGIKLIKECKEANIKTKIIVCSSARENVDAFDNAVDYIMYHGGDLSDRFKLSLV